MSQTNSPYAGTSKVASLSGRELVTVLDGQSFCISSSTGDIFADQPMGLFVLDTRMISRWELRLNGSEPESLAHDNDAPFSAVFLGRGNPSEGHADSDLVVFRRRHVGNGMRETITVENHGLEPRHAVVELECDVDFAGLFEVKESRVRRRGHHRYETSPGAMSFVQLPGEHAADGSGRGLEKEVRLCFSGEVEVSGNHAMWDEVIDPGGKLDICVEVSICVAGNPIQGVFVCGGDDDKSLPNQRLVTWKARLPVLSSDDVRLEACVNKSREDLGSLRIFDPEHPDVPVLAAGAPWFMTVFGRDSLITAWMALPADRSLVRGVLRTLARFQGQKVDPQSEEQPGKILHEMRFGEATGTSLGGGDTYYGTVDATPLFVMLAGELHRWDPDDATVGDLLSNIDAAMAWIEHYGDRDGDGYVEYERSTDNSLANQGWKDSWDAIRFADGRLAEPPIALCEVQGYVYAAYLARAGIARHFGDDATAEDFEGRARDLKERFNRDFWDERSGFYVLALDGDKRPVDGLASNVGHCLWTGIVDESRSAQVARRLLSPEFFSGWGIRTLSHSMNAYNPISYHNGSVWPHDNAICASGLKRYGHAEEALRIITAQIRTAATQGFRLPELFAGFDRSRLPIAASYPTSCSPQAWASASPLLWLRTILGFEADLPNGEVWLDPTLPVDSSRLALDDIDLGGQKVSVAVSADGLELRGVDELVVHRGRRPLR